MDAVYRGGDSTLQKANSRQHNTGEASSNIGGRIAFVIHKELIESHGMATDV